jgi:hypothetical protein
MNAESMNYGIATRIARSAAAICLALVAGFASAAATIIINNVNQPGVGFNDPTPTAPVGGNLGTTLGQQRLIAFTYAANLWGATVTSTVPIRIRASFEPLDCDANSGTLGSAGAITVYRDFTGAPLAATLYPIALVNKILGFDRDPEDDIRARFNSNLGNPDCLAGSSFYYGLDANHGTQIDFVTVLLHELGHGLGFQTFTNRATGAQLFGFPSVWDHYLLDNTQNKLWVNMTDAERVASAINTRNLVWIGAKVAAAAPDVLSDTPQLNISGPAAGPAAGNYVVGTAVFGPALSSPGIIGDLMPVIAQAGGTGPGCEPFNAVNTLSVRGNIALIDRGVCAFVVKVKNAQNAGAIGVVIADNVTASSPPGLGGSDPTITIPTASITLDAGNALKDRLKTRSRSKSGVLANLGVDTSQLAGADRAGHMLMYTPNPLDGDSSVVHFDTSATPNQLMEPFLNSDLTHTVIPPLDLTFRLLQDIGW